MIKYNIFILIVVFALMGCSKNNSPAQKPVLNTVDCMPDRKDAGTAENLQGVIKLIADKYVIETQEGNGRYGPCNLPDTYLTDGMVVRFSVVLKEIRPNERWMASPCYLTNIEKPE
jgi:hypothetical protein